jgi:HEPN domain-containing protein
MTGNETAIKKRAKEWVQAADEDLRLARHAFKLKSAVPYKLIAYHAQQCAEKSLKAYLVSKKIDFPYTHNISLLFELLPPSADWSKELSKAEILSSYAITTRYPGRDKVTKKEAIEAVSLAETVKGTVIKALAREGFKIPSGAKAGRL